MFEIKGITKKYWRKIVLDDVSFEVDKGKICALCGVNGAGKTTLLKIMAGLTIPQSGILLVDGKPFVYGETPVVSCLIEDPKFYPHLTGFDNLWLLYQLSGGKDKEVIHSAMEKVGLKAKENIKYSKYSLGMKKRLYLAFSIMRDSDLILLDEPFNGLDPLAVKKIKEIVVDLSKQGKTILLSSHMIAELEDIVDAAIFIDHGKIIYNNKNASGTELHKLFIEMVPVEGEAE